MLMLCHWANSFQPFEGAVILQTALNYSCTNMVQHSTKDLNLQHKSLVVQESYFRLLQSNPVSAEITHQFNWASCN
jgi:hypothetical protein